MRPSVLLVDDVEANLTALESQLSGLACDTIFARSGNEALKLLLKREFAVMLLDVQMPEMDGFEVARYARDDPKARDLPIIFVTAMHETEQDVVRGYGAGAVDFLFKPVNPYILRSKVQVFLDLYVSRRKLALEIEAHTRTLAELEAFNYSVSHDLRAPLRPLDGFSKVLLEEYGDKLDPRAKDYLARIRAGAQRMGQLIDDMLQLSRVSRAEPRFRSVSISDLTESIIAELRSEDPSRDVQVVIAPGIETRADARLLRIALENLLRNAWKFTRATKVPRIELGTCENDRQRAFFVRDNGAGFDMENAGKLFQPFQRLHSMSEFEGTGIGLAIVDRVVRHHGGRVWAEARPNEGATFYFTLPTKSEHDEPSTPPR